MAKGLIAGMTDYSHQSFNDLLTDLKGGADLVAEFIEGITKQVERLKASGYWDKKVPGGFRSIVSYSLKFYSTTQEELLSIYSEVQQRVEEHHCKRLSSIAKVADEINNDIGRFWNNDYERFKDYDDPEFHEIENVYGDTRDLAATLLDFSNLSGRLEDFIGKTSYMEKKKTANFEGAQFGDNTVIVVGDHNIVSPSQVKSHDLKTLEDLLLNNKVAKEDVEEIKEIVTAETPDKENGRLGPRANSWIAKMVQKSLDGTWAIGIGAAGKLLADGIKHYYGLFQ